jgi:hypothetical protein
MLISKAFYSHLPIFLNHFKCLRVQYGKLETVLAIFLTLEYSEACILIVNLFAYSMVKLVSD